MKLVRTSSEGFFDYFSPSDENGVRLFKGGPPMEIWGAHALDFFDTLPGLIRITIERTKDGSNLVTYVFPMGEYDDVIDTDSLAARG